EEKVDNSDEIRVIGHNKSLMFLVCNIGVKLFKKGWNSLNTAEKFMAEVSLNSIVDLHDNFQMKSSELDEQAVQDVKKRFMSSKLTYPNIN
ncbi:MAG: hypothetical protein EXX96DRAFT_463706, partial [Benjaminiella poitrasii]